MSQALNSPKELPANYYAVVVLALRVSGIGIQAITLLILANNVDPESLGIYASVLAVTAIARLIGPLGLDQVALRGRLHGYPSGSDIWPAAIVVFTVNISLSLVIFVTIALFNFGIGLIELFIASLIVPAVSVSGLLAGYLRGAGRAISAQAPESVLSPAIVLGFTVVAMRFGVIDLKALLLLLLISNAAVAILYINILRKFTPITNIEYIVKRVCAHLSDSVSIIISLIFTAFSARAPILLALPIVGAAGAADMEIANRFGTLASIITGSVAVTYSTQFAMLLSKDRLSEAKGLLIKGAILSGLAAIIVAIALAVSFALVFREVLPPTYSGAYTPMILLATATAINATFGLSSSLLFMDGKARLVGFASAGQAAILVFLGTGLGQSFGNVGIALACIVGSLIRDGSLFLYVMVKLKR